MTRMNVIKSILVTILACLALERAFAATGSPSSKNHAVDLKIYGCHKEASCPLYLPDYKDAKYNFPHISLINSGQSLKEEDLQKYVKILEKFSKDSSGSPWAPSLISKAHGPTPFKNYATMYEVSLNKDETINKLAG